jgi:hypothetical protein
MFEDAWAYDGGFRSGEAGKDEGIKKLFEQARGFEWICRGDVW